MTGRIPRFLLVHQVTVEPYLGDTAYGPRYGPPSPPARCLVDEQTRMVRAKDGREISSSSTVYAPLDTACPVDSRVTLPDGRTATVIAALRRDGGRLGVPSHLEIQLT